MPAAKKITFWSYSRYAAYCQCPAAAKYKFLDKLPEPKNAAMDRGNEVHKAAEDYIKGTLAKIPKELVAVSADLSKLRKLYKARLKLGLAGMSPAIEDTWAFKADWTETTWNDWNECWVRIKLDAAWWSDPETVDVDDWKSGKFTEGSNEQYLEQLELYGLGALLKFPHAQRVRPRLRYTDQGITFPPADAPIVYTRADIPRLKKAWAKRTRAMLNDAKFAPRPGWYCPGCYFNKSKTLGWKNKVDKPAGPCKF